MASLNSQETPIVDLKYSLAFPLVIDDRCAFATCLCKFFISLQYPSMRLIEIIEICQCANALERMNLRSVTLV